jgi:hypothetical protein
LPGPKKVHDEKITFFDTEPPDYRPGYYSIENKMNDPKYDEALALFGQPKPAPAMSLHEIEQQRIRANMARLKADRLNREAAQT